MRKHPGERRLETVTWGLLLVWLGVMMMIEEPEGLAGVGAGAILLLSAVLQKLLKWEAGAVLWIAGVALVFSGINELLGDREVPVLAIVLLVVGALVIGRAMAPRRPRKGPDGSPPSRTIDL
ncbi:MAG TPA: hypothetical protein VM600_02275 [Actinomycetota bacterium]|nr:hypothetical protein [Actinomycetota bacterium]